MTHEALLLHVKSYKDKHLCHYLHYKLNETLFSLSTIFTWKTDYSYSDWVLAYLFFKMNQVSQLLQGMLPVIVYFSSENLNFEKCVCYCQSLIASQYWRHFWWVSGVTNYCGFFFFFFFGYCTVKHVSFWKEFKVHRRVLESHYVNLKQTPLAQLWFRVREEELQWSEMAVKTLLPLPKIYLIEDGFSLYISPKQHIIVDWLPKKIGEPACLPWSQTLRKLAKVLKHCHTSPWFFKMLFFHK